MVKVQLMKQDSLSMVIELVQTQIHCRILHLESYVLHLIIFTK
jgi:hypothetical protein